jgi:hypothetical protein
VSKQPVALELKPAERRLIEEIRAMKDGKIEIIKIQHGLPVYYKILLQEELFEIAE